MNWTHWLQVALGIAIAIVPQLSTAFPAQAGFFQLVGTVCGGVLGALSGMHAAALSSAKTETANANAATAQATMMAMRAAPPEPKP